MIYMLYYVYNMFRRPKALCLYTSMLILYYEHRIYIHRENEQQEWTGRPQRPQSGVRTT